MNPEVRKLLDSFAKTENRVELTSEIIKFKNWKEMSETIYIRDHFSDAPKEFERLAEIALVAIKKARIEAAYNYIKISVDGLLKSFQNKPNKISKLFMNELQTRIRKETFDWVEKYLDKYGSITKAHYEVKKKKYLEVFK